MSERIKELIQLVKKHPDYEVIAMVDSEVVPDDGYNRWSAEIGKSYIEEITFHEMYNQFSEMVVKSDTENLEEFMLQKHLDWTEDDVEKYVKKLPWKKVIILNIDTP